MTREKRAELRKLLLAAVGGEDATQPYYVALGDEVPPPSAESHRVIRCESVEDVALVAATIASIEELLDDADSLEETIESLDAEIVELRAEQGRIA